MPVMKSVLEKFGLRIVECRRDMRYLHVEKIATLLRWRWLLSIARMFRIHRLPFPMYAYPSKIVVAQKVGPSGDADD
jgi:hypothetical protein